MRDYCLMFTQIPGRMQMVDYINYNFDLVQFNVHKMDTEVLNQYDFIWMYIVSGAFEMHYKPLRLWDFPKWLRDNGVTEPKIVFQADYWGGERNTLAATYRQMINYVDGLVHCTNREWKEGIPVFYQQFPIRIVHKPAWVQHKDKVHRAVSLKRHYGGVGQNSEKAKGLGLESVTLRHDIPGKPGREYMEYLADSLLVLDYTNRYWGWSRMVYEATVAGTPVIGDRFRKGIEIIYPELVGRELSEIKEMILDKDTYDSLRYEGKRRADSHLSQKECANRIKDMIATLV